MSIQTYINRIGAMPDPITLQFRAWQEKGCQSIIDYCVAACSGNTVYYFDSVAGNDANSGLTTSLPKQSFAAMKTLITSPGGNVTIACKRGSKWAPWTDSGITYGFNFMSSINNVAIIAYGPGLTTPIFSGYLIQYDTGTNNGWTLVSGTLWKRAESNPIAKIHLQGTADPSTLTGVAPAVYGGFDIPDASLVELFCGTSSAVVGGIVGSWWCDTAGTDPNSGSTPTLYVNLGSTSAPPAMESVYGQTNSGIVVNGDGCLLHGIRFEGFGCIGVNAAGNGDQYYAIQFQATNGDAFAVVDCEGYDGNFHNVGMLQTGSGGIMARKGGRFGWCAQNGSSGFATEVAYASLGGHEYFAEGGEMLPGRLPQAAAMPTTIQYAGQFFVSHTGSGNASMISVNRVRPLRVNMMGSGNGSINNVAASSTRAGCTGLFADIHYPDPCGVSGDPGFAPYLGYSAGTAWINPKILAIVAPSAAYLTTGVAMNGFVVNGDVEYVFRGSTPAAEINDTAAANIIQCFNTRLAFSGNLAASWTMFNTSESNSGAAFQNCDFIIQNVAMGSFGGTTLPAMSANCYLNTPDTGDSYPVAALTTHLDDTPTSSLSELFANGRAYSGGGAIEFDQNWNPRNLVTPNIGPREVNPGLSVTQQQTVKFGYETGRTLTFRSYTQGSSPTLVQTIPLTESPAGSSNYVTSTALTLGTPITYTITDSVSGVVGTGVM